MSLILATSAEGDPSELSHSVLCRTTPFAFCLIDSSLPSSTCDFVLEPLGA